MGCSWPAKVPFNVGAVLSRHGRGHVCHFVSRLFARAVRYAALTHEGRFVVDSADVCMSVSLQQCSPVLVVSK